MCLNADEQIFLENVGLFHFLTQMLGSDSWVLLLGYILPVTSSFSVTQMMNPLTYPFTPPPPWKFHLPQTNAQTGPRHDAVIYSSFCAVQWLELERYWSSALEYQLLTLERQRFAFDELEMKLEYLTDEMAWATAKITL